MPIIRLAKGFVKTVTGIATGESAVLLDGLKDLAIGTVTTVVAPAIGLGGSVFGDLLEGADDIGV